MWILLHSSCKLLQNSVSIYTGTVLHPYKKFLRNYLFLRSTTMPNTQKRIFQILMELLVNASFYGDLITSSLHDNHTNSYILIKDNINNQIYDPMPYRYCAIKMIYFFPYEPSHKSYKETSLTNMHIRVNESKISNGKFESSLGADTVPYRHV